MGSADIELIAKSADVQSAGHDNLDNRHVSYRTRFLQRLDAFRNCAAASKIVGLCHEVVQWAYE